MPSPVYATYSDMPSWGINAPVLASIPGGSTTVTNQLSSASRYMDGYFRSQYVLPILQWGDDVVECCCVIAAYKSVVIRGFNPQAGGDINLRLRYEDMLAWLKQIGQKQVTPSMTDSSPGSTEGITTQGPVVTSDTQRGYSARQIQPNGDEPGDFVSGLPGHGGQGSFTQ